MTTLKDIIEDLHTQAENLPYTKHMVAGELSAADYAQYLYQLLLIYDPIEFGCQAQGLFEGLEGLYRLPQLYQDYRELAGPNQLGQWLPETLSYHQYLIELLNDPQRRHRIQAHLYVRHAGDMSGGQVIAQQAPGAGRLYEFDHRATLKTALIERLDPDELGEEARTAFAWNLKLLEALGRAMSGE